MPGPLLRVRDLVTSFQTDRGRVRAVDGVSFDVPAGGSLGIVGESGCGKSVTALSVLRLVPDPPGRIEGGAIEFGEKNLLSVSSAEMRSIRGNEISMVFQEPMTSLNPVYTVGWQIVEAVRLHQKASRSEAWDRAVEMLRLVGIPSPETNARAYPHQLSGGMRQRVMIAMAIACEPRLLIADEPTTALDVTVQAQVLDLLLSIRDRFGMAILLITHDLGVVAETADRVAVMYAGRKIEENATAALFAAPEHPYTRGLLAASPEIEPGDTATGRARHRLDEIPGMVPALDAMPPGCRFAPRCPEAREVCNTAPPPLLPMHGGRVACYARQEAPVLAKIA